MKYEFNWPCCYSEKSLKFINGSLIWVTLVKQSKAKLDLRYVFIVIDSLR